MSAQKRKFIALYDDFSSPNKKRVIAFLPFDLNSTAAPKRISYFKQLPTEIVDSILMKLSPHDLHRLASSSNEYFLIVFNFLRSTVGTQYLESVLRTSIDRRRAGPWQKLGRLYGLMTSLMPLSRRVQTLKEVFFHKLKLTTEPGDLTSIGRFLGEATKNWTEREITWTFSQFEVYFQILKKIERFYSCEKVGVETSLEENLRVCFRSVYFDSIRLHAHRGCLLNLILHKQPIWFQARLIYLIFGPLFLGKIDWDKFTRERNNLFNYPNADEEQAYFDLSRAFSVLNRSTSAQKDWNSNSKLALFNELIGKSRARNVAIRIYHPQPNPWRSEYIAELLFYCGRELLTNVLIAFALKNYHKEYAQLIHSLCIVARQRKAYYEIIQRAIEDSFERCSSGAQRNSIILHLQQAFRCITRNVIAVLASSTITPNDQLHYLQQLEALDAQKASLISYLLTNQFDEFE